MIAPASEVASSLRQQLHRWLQVSTALKGDPKTRKALTPAEVCERKRLRVLVATGQPPPLGSQRLQVLNRKAEDAATSYLASRTDVSWTLTVLYADGGRVRYAGLDYETAAEMKTASLNDDGVVEAVLEPEEVYRG